MRHYLVTVEINAGEYEKHSTYLIRASSFDLASNYAIFCEAHMPEELDWSEDRVVDMHGEFAYRSNVQKVSLEDAVVWEKYFPVHTASLSELLKSGNFKEYRYVEPKQVPLNSWECSLAQATAYFLNDSENHYADYLRIKHSESNELPSGLTVRGDMRCNFLIFDREETLGEIEKLAKVIESAVMRSLEIAGNELARANAAPPIPLGIALVQGLHKENGLDILDSKF